MRCDKLSFAALQTTIDLDAGFPIEDREDAWVELAGEREHHGEGHTWDPEDPQHDAHSLARVSVAATLPVTETTKVLKRVLRRDRWETDDEVWWQPEKGGEYRRLTPADVDALRAEFTARGRQPVLEAT